MKFFKTKILTNESVKHLSAKWRQQTICQTKRGALCFYVWNQKKKNPTLIWDPKEHLKKEKENPLVYIVFFLTDC